MTTPERLSRLEEILDGLRDEGVPEDAVGRIRDSALRVMRPVENPDDRKDTKSAKPLRRFG